MGNSVVVALFRHGLTAYNQRKAIIGWSDFQLSHDGRMQLKEIKDKLPEYEKVFSSDLQRCMETARLLFPAADPILIPDLRELNFGIWEGKTHQELEKDGVYQSWLDDYLSVRPPEGELFPEFAERVDRGWNKLKEEMLQNGVNRAIAVTHGGVIKYLLSKFAPYEQTFWEWKVKHGHGYELEWENNAFRRGERCTLLREVPLTEKQNG
ncbi:histidine phosphatase family protein [Bacillus methanolicus]|uniref:histidine phosphatase family protein n=1 Tax=Bacillus methanolicus TaxID=1471 RepID=UPI0023801348|nr:histidine phosphatase family protein [Bacillus methanolicus]MDE3840695.1 histidine phosphatase family protein [Bacillus methanolicus]